MVRMLLACAAAAALLAVAPAYAATLNVAPGAPAWMHWGALALLWTHIGGGAAGMLSGAVALVTRKGSPPHRLAGKVFFAAMLVCYAIGAGVAPFLDEGQRPNLIAGVMALYLLLSGWRAAQAPVLKAGAAEVAGLGAALLLAGAGAVFMRMGASDPSGTVDGSPPQAFVLFITAGLFAAAGEIHALARKQLAGPARLARHLWRMCMSLFIASGSFFFGQAQLLPDWLIGYPQLALGFAPLAALAVWLTITLWPRRRCRAAPA